MYINHYVYSVFRVQGFIRDTTAALWFEFFRSYTPSTRPKTLLVSKCSSFFFSSYEAAAAIGNPVVPIS